MIESLKILLPELFLSGVALLLLFMDAFESKRRKSWTVFISILSLLVALALVLFSPWHGRAFGMVALDGFSTFFKLLAITGSILVLLLSEEDTALMGKTAGTYSALVILSTVGVMFLSSAEDLLILFIGLELTTLPLFILTGFLRNELRSSEGAIKFFLVGAFSTGLMLYGISYLYGICGSTHFAALRGWFQSTAHADHSLLFLLAILFLLVGLGFKLSLVPFHQWVPDAYEGAPTPITAFFSISREAGVIAVMLRFFSEFVNLSAAGLTHFFAVLSVLTMTIGNLAALRQENLKRLLAYSSIAHAGTIFIGLVSGNQLGREGAMLYSLAYFLMSLGAFAVVIVVSRIKNSDELFAVQGLGKENFSLAFLMVFFLLSLSGIPPFLGFWGKFYVFASAIEAKMYWLVAIGLINSVIAVYYYFRIAHKMFFEEAKHPLSLGQEPTADADFVGEEKAGEKVQGQSIWMGASIRVATFSSAVAILLLGIFPQTLLHWIRTMAHLLP